MVRYLRVESLRAFVVLLRVAVVGLLTQQYAQIVLAQLVLIGGCVRCSERTINHLVGLQRTRTFLVGVSKGAPVAAAVDERQFGTVSSLECKLLDRLPLKIYATVESIALAPLVVVHGSGKRVGVAVGRKIYVGCSVLVEGLLPRF